MPIIKRPKGQKAEPLSKFDVDNSARSRTKRTINKHKYEAKMKFIKDLNERTLQKDLFELNEVYCEECGELIATKDELTSYDKTNLHTKCYFEKRRKEHDENQVVEVKTDG